MMFSTKILLGLTKSTNLALLNVTKCHFSLFNNSRILSTCLPQRFNNSVNTQLWPSSKLPQTYEARRHYKKRKGRRPVPVKTLGWNMPGEIDPPPELDYVDLSQPRIGFEDVEELQNVEEVVKRIFSLEMADGQELKAKRMSNILEQVKEHPLDVKSFEVQIAELTVHIRHQLKHFLNFKKDKKNKVILFNRLQKRRSIMEKLRRSDIQKFDWLMKELKIKYTPIPEHNRKIGKRVLRMQAAKNVFLEVKKNKLQEFREKLAEERVTFEEVKKKELTDIQKELKEFGIEKEFTTLRQMIDALDLDEKLLPEPPKKMKRRYQLLAKKFELYAHRKHQN